MKEIVHLQSFLAVARTGSLTLAAEELHVTPSLNIASVSRVWPGG